MYNSGWGTLREAPKMLKSTLLSTDLAPKKLLYKMSPFKKQILYKMVSKILWAKFDKNLSKKLQKTASLQKG